MTKIAVTTFKREAYRDSHDYKLTCEVLDAGKICHVGFTLEDQPYVVPMAYARLDDHLMPASQGRPEKIHYQGTQRAQPAGAPHRNVQHQMSHRPAGGQ